VNSQPPASKIPKHIFGTFMGSTSSQASTPDFGDSPLKTCRAVVSFYLIQMAIELLKRAISGSQLDTSYYKKGRKLFY